MGINWSAALDRLSQGLGQAAGMRFQREDREARETMDERRMLAQQAFQENLARFQVKAQQDAAIEGRKYDSEQRGLDREASQANADRSYELQNRGLDLQASGIAASAARENAQAARYSAMEQRQLSAEEQAKADRENMVRRETLKVQVVDLDNQIASFESRLYGDPEKMQPGLQGKQAEELQKKIENMRADRNAVFQEYVKSGSGFMAEPEPTADLDPQATPEEMEALGLGKGAPKAGAQPGPAPSPSGRQAPAQPPSLGADMMDDEQMRTMLAAGVQKATGLEFMDPNDAELALLKADTGQKSRMGGREHAARLEELERNAMERELAGLKEPGKPTSRGGMVKRDQRIAELEAKLGVSQPAAEPQLAAPDQMAGDAQGIAQKIASDPAAEEIRSAVDRASSGDPASRQSAAELIAAAYPGIDAGEVLAMLLSPQ